MEHLSNAKIVVKSAERHCVCVQLKTWFTVKVKSLQYWKKKGFLFQVFHAPFQLIARFFTQQAEGKRSKNYMEIVMLQ